MKPRSLGAKVFAVLSLPLLFGVGIAAQCFNDPTCVLYVLDSVAERDAYALHTLSVGSSQQTYLDAGHIEVDNGGGWLSSSYLATGDGHFSGTVYADEIVAFVKNFRIDDPLDPAHKVLVHSSVESSEMKDIYDGIVSLDETGGAWVTLPRWFDRLNGDYRYQLTSVGVPAELYVADEIADGRFRIAGGKANQKVSWQVTGIRRDPSALRMRAPVEQEKKPAERGKYLDPAAYGQPASMGTSSERPHPSARKTPPKGEARNGVRRSSAPEGAQLVALRACAIGARNVLASIR